MRAVNSSFEKKPNNRKKKGEWEGERREKGFPVDPVALE